MFCFRFRKILRHPHSYSFFQHFFCLCFLSDEPNSIEIFLREFLYFAGTHFIQSVILSKLWKWSKTFSQKSISFNLISRDRRKSTKGKKMNVTVNAFPNEFWSCTHVDCVAYTNFSHLLSTKWKEQSHQPLKGASHHSTHQSIHKKIVWMNFCHLLRTNM